VLNGADVMVYKGAIVKRPGAVTESYFATRVTSCLALKKVKAPWGSEANVMDHLPHNPTQAAQRHDRSGDAVGSDGTSTVCAGGIPSTKNVQQSL
jgi:hypothetical protein